MLLCVLLVFLLIINIFMHENSRSGISEDIFTETALVQVLTTYTKLKNAPQVIF